MLYEPGTSWSYGASIDWAGLLVERLSGLTLEQYMEANIWGPLGIKDITFWPEKRPELLKRMADTTLRDPQSTGQVVHYVSWKAAH